MTHTGKGRILLILMTVLCVLLAVLLVAGTVSLYLEGTARKAENPLESIYTPEQIAQKAGILVLPGLLFLCLLTAGIVSGVRDDRAGKTAEESGIPQPGKLPKHRKRIRTAVVAAAAALILAGILNGSALDVLIKAIHICSECIGLG